MQAPPLSQGTYPEHSHGDVSVGVIRDMEAPSPVLVVVFGGLASSFGGTPPFEFLRVLNCAGPARKLFFRDDHQAWYHRGVRGVSNSIGGVEAEIRRVIGTMKPSKVVMLGSSAGGYAALLFGRRIGASEVHAFGPQTFISPGLRLRYGDHRFLEQWSALMLSGRYRPWYGDLYRLFRRTPSDHGHFVIHYAHTDKLDSIHARRLGHHPDVTVMEYEQGGHNVAKYLRDNGQLQPLLRRALRY